VVLAAADAAEDAAEVLGVVAGAVEETTGLVAAPVVLAGVEEAPLAEPLPAAAHSADCKASAAC